MQFIVRVFLIILFTMDEFIFVWKQKQARLSQLPLKQIYILKRQQQQSIENIQKIIKTKEEKTKQSEKIDNYFDMDDLASFAQTIKTIQNIFRIQDVEKSAIFHKNFVQVYNIPLKDNKSLTPTKKSKIQVCFTRNQREPQHTIYLLFTRFHTNDQQTKIRVLILNQRGFILQVLSNINPKNYYEIIGKKVKSFYTRIENIFILSQKEKYCDFDSMLALKSVVENGNGKKEDEREVNVIFILIGSSSDFGQVQFRKKNLGGVSRLYVQNEKINFLALRQSNVVFCSLSQLSQVNLMNYLSIISQTIQLVSKMKQLFQSYREDSQCFNQRQFFLILFCFSFNFLKISQQKDTNIEQLKLQILLQSIKQMMVKKCQIEQKQNNIQEHCYYINKTILSCLVCEKKTRVTCLKCCEQYNGDFSLCTKFICFQEFHKNPKNYIHKIKPRKMSRIQKKRVTEPINKSDSSSQNSEQILNTSQTKQKTSIQDLRRKWGSYIQQNQKETMDCFFRKAMMNFVPRKIMDRMNLFSLRINELSYKLMPDEIKVKQEE